MLGHKPLSWTLELLSVGLQREAPRTQQENYRELYHIIPGTAGKPLLQVPKEATGVYFLSKDTNDGKTVYIYICTTEYL